MFLLRGKYVVIPLVDSFSEYLGFTKNIINFPTPAELRHAIRSFQCYVKIRKYRLIYLVVENEPNNVI